MNIARVKKQNGRKQKQAVKKTKAAKKIKAASKKKSKGKKMIIFNIFVRKQLSSPKRMIKDTVTHYNPDMARQLAAAKHHNLWVSIKPAMSARA